MDYKKAYAIAIKDMKEVFSSTSIYGPMLGVPLFFAIALPILTNYVATYAAPGIASRLFNATVAASIPKGTSANSVLFMSFFSVSVLGPIFLTMPILTASVIAADSFAGEKERKTAEALLAAPVKTSELLFGKILASLVPTIVLTLLVFAFYGSVVNYLALKAFHVTLLPTLPWLLMILTSPFLALATISVIILVSAHVRGVKEAQQVSTLLALPILIMPFAAILGISTLNVTFFASVIAFLIAVDVIILYISAKTFKREALL